MMSEPWLRPILDRFYSDRRNFHKKGNSKENAYSEAEIKVTEIFSAITRLEMVDHTPCKKCNGEGYLGEVTTESKDGKTTTTRPKECPDCFGLGSPGRSVVFWDKNKQIELSLQDEGRTLKVFITKRGSE